MKHDSRKPDGTFTRPMEYTFDGFAGTPYGTKLKGTRS